MIIVLSWISLHHIVEVGIVKDFINDFILFESEINIFTVFIRIVLAVIFGGIIGNERGKHGSQAGLRTHILVCLGATMTSLVGLFSNEILGYNGDPFRISAQVVSGIGFLGAGMIIVKNGNSITGLTTAAGMWTTATIGLAIGVGFYSGALLVMLACVFTAAFLTRIERKRKKSTHLYVEIDDISNSGDITDKLRELLKNDCLLDIIPAKSGKEGNIGIFIVTSNIKNTVEFRKSVQKIDGVCFSIVE